MIYKVILPLVVVFLGLYVVNYFIVLLYVIYVKNRMKEEYKEASEGNKPLTEKRPNLAILLKWMKHTVYLCMEGWIMHRIVVLGRIPCNWYRLFILRWIYKMKIEKDAVLYGGFQIRSPWNISVGKGSVIGDNVILDGRNGICIKENVNFSTGVSIWTEQHDPNDTMFRCNKGGPVVIENRAWISANAIILPRITIGEGAVVAAGGVVTKDCERFWIYGGVPAKKIHRRNQDLEYVLNSEKPLFFF